MATTSPPSHLAEWYHADLTDASVADMVATLESATAAGDTGSRSA